MIPGTYNFEIYKGGTLDTDIESEEDSVAFSFTPYTAIRMYIRHIWERQPYDRDPLVMLTLANGGITLSGVGDTVLTINMTAAATAAITWGSGKYDLELVIEEAGEEDIVDKFLRGEITVIGESTI